MKKNKYKIYLSLSLAVIGIIILTNFIPVKAEIKPSQIDINAPNLCYSLLEPSHYFVGISPSLVTENIDGTIKLLPRLSDSLRTVQTLDTGSMRPTISGGSILIIIEPEHESDLLIGDIIVTKSGVNSQYSRGVAHRIVAKINNSYQLKGDNNVLPDPVLWNFSSIKGKVVGILY